jgi:single-strand DNA-binding protein
MLCKVNLIGNIGRDAELKYTPQGQAVCEFSLATSEKVKSSNGEAKEHTTWFRISIWGKQAENFSEYFNKGRQVYVEGHLKVREYLNKEGKLKTALEVDAIDFRFLGGNKEQPSSNSSNKNSVGVEDPFVTTSKN